MIQTLLRWREFQRSEPVGQRRRVRLAASFTADHLVPSIGVALAEHGDGVADISVAAYNQIFQMCLQREAYGLGDIDDIVVLWRLEDVFERDFHAWTAGDDDAADRIAEGAAQLAAALAELARTSNGTVVSSDAPVPIGFGLDHGDPVALSRLVLLQQSANEAFDEALGQAQVGRTIERVRFAALQLAHGSERAFDRRNWLMYRQPLSDGFGEVVGRAIADVILDRTRVPPKVLVLDCDNTLWGGVAAEDGIGGIACGDAFPGIAYQTFQRVAQRLRHQGVMLALVSKNDPETVARVFRDAEGMVLRDDDIVARRVSWDPKPLGLVEIAAELNVGIDSLVFVDDSEFEIGSVRTQLPEVRCLLVPESIEELPDLLAESGWFRRLRVTDDDRERTVRMQAERSRAAASTAMTHADFLASMGLVVTVSRADEHSTGRVTQLANKTNQFNLTTRRRTEAEITELMADPNAAVITATVTDNFGEYGLVGVVIGRFDGRAWNLDTVLMSCRVLGRGVETALLSASADIMRAAHPGPITGRYVDSGRNHLVSDLLPDHGFERQTGSDVLTLASDQSIAPPSHATVIVP